MTTQDLYREALTFCNLKHPCILQWIGIARYGRLKVPALVTPWAHNGNIMSYLQSNTVTVDQKMEWVSCGDSSGYIELDLSLLSCFKLLGELHICTLALAVLPSLNVYEGAYS